MFDSSSVSGMLLLSITLAQDYEDVQGAFIRGSTARSTDNKQADCAEIMIFLRFEVCACHQLGLWSCMGVGFSQRN